MSFIKTLPNELQSRILSYVNDFRTFKNIAKIRQFHDLLYKNCEILTDCDTNRGKAAGIFETFDFLEKRTFAKTTGQLASNKIYLVILQNIINIQKLRTKILANDFEDGFLKILKNGYLVLLNSGRNFSTIHNGLNLVLLEEKIYLQKQAIDQITTISSETAIELFISNVSKPLNDAYLTFDLPQLVNLSIVEYKTDFWPTGMTTISTKNLKHLQLTFSKWEIVDLMSFDVSNLQSLSITNMHKMSNCIFPSLTLMSCKWQIRQQSEEIDSDDIGFFNVDTPSLEDLRLNSAPKKVHLSVGMASSTLKSVLHYANLTGIDRPEFKSLESMYKPFERVPEWNVNCPTFFSDLVGLSQNVKVLSTVCYNNEDTSLLSSIQLPNVERLNVSKYSIGDTCDIILNKSAKKLKSLTECYSEEEDEGFRSLTTFSSLQECYADLEDLTFELYVECFLTIDKILADAVSFETIKTLKYLTLNQFPLQNTIDWLLNGKKVFASLEKFTLSWYHADNNLDFSEESEDSDDSMSPVIKADTVLMRNIENTFPNLRKLDIQFVADSEAEMAIEISQCSSLESLSLQGFKEIKVSSCAAIKSIISDNVTALKSLEADSLDCLETLKYCKLRSMKESDIEKFNVSSTTTRSVSDYHG